MRRAAAALARLTAAALFVGCNAILGIGSDYHLAEPGDGGEPGDEGGGTSGAGANVGGGLPGGSANGGRAGGGALGGAAGSGVGGASAGAGRGGTSPSMGGTGGGSGGTTNAGTGGAGGSSGSGTSASGGTGGSAGSEPGPGCGNGKLESDLAEGCDDGGTAPGDGCNSTCSVESGWTCLMSTLSICNAEYPSCEGASGDDCKDDAATADCCTSQKVVGGTFTQGKDTSHAFEATVSDFALDEYEVTVARFRRFFDDYEKWHGVEKRPLPGDGANPNVPGSGWSELWSDDLPDSAPGWDTTLACGSYPTWSAPSGDLLPINCVSWFDAFAFCIWDGGRLPTESEWEYAAVGGNNGWVYPWNNPYLENPPENPADYCTHACLGDGSAAGDCSSADIRPVGSATEGLSDSYSHYDQCGSMAEWTLDWDGPLPTSEVTDYANVDAGTDRVVRGSSWTSTTNLRTTASREAHGPSQRLDTLGFRCARIVPPEE